MVTLGGTERSGELSKWDLCSPEDRRVRVTVWESMCAHVYVCRCVSCTLKQTKAQCLFYLMSLNEISLCFSMSALWRDQGFYMSFWILLNVEWLTTIVHPFSTTNPGLLLDILVRLVQTSVSSATSSSSSWGVSLPIWNTLCLQHVLGLLPVSSMSWNTITGIPISFQQEGAALTLPDIQTANPFTKVKTRHHHIPAASMHHLIALYIYLVYIC